MSVPVASDNMFVLEYVAPPRTGLGLPRCGLNRGVRQQFTGGQYEKMAPTACIRMTFNFSMDSGSYHKRYLSKLILENKNGSRANALTEAFE